MLTQVPQTDKQQTAYCEGAPLVMTWMRSILSASQRGQVDGALLICRNKGRPPGDWREGCETVDACLELANQASDPKKSADWKWDAAAASENAGDVLKAVDILLSYTSEEKEAAGQWDRYYLDFCLAALQKLYADKDSNGIQHILDRSPDDVRPGVMLLFARLLDNRREDRPYATSMLANARLALEKHPVQDPTLYVQLLRLYTQLLPEDSSQAFGFVVSGLNQIDYEEIGKERAKQDPRIRYAWNKPGFRLEPIGIDGVIIEQDEPYVVAALKSLDDPETRIAFRLTFLLLTNNDRSSRSSRQHKQPEFRRGDEADRASSSLCSRELDYAVCTLRGSLHAYMFHSSLRLTLQNLRCCTVLPHLSGKSTDLLPLLRLKLKLQLSTNQKKVLALWHELKMR